MLANYAERYLLKMADGLDRRERKIQMKKNLSLTFVFFAFSRHFYATRACISFEAQEAGQKSKKKTGTIAKTI